VFGSLCRFDSSTYPTAILSLNFGQVRTFRAKNHNRTNRSIANEDEKIDILRNAVNNIPLHLSISGEDNLTCIGIAAQKREYQFAQELGLCLEKQYGRLLEHTKQQAALELQRIIVEKDSHIKELQERKKIFGIWQIDLLEQKCARISAENEKLKIEHKEEIEKYKVEVDNLKKEAAGNEALENGEIQRKLEKAVEQIAVERKIIERYSGSPLLCRPLLCRF
jgi:hypothetical protein